MITRPELIQILRAMSADELRSVLAESKICTPWRYYDIGGRETTPDVYGSNPRAVYAQLPTYVGDVVSRVANPYGVTLTAIGEAEDLALKAGYHLPWRETP